MRKFDSDVQIIKNKVLSQVARFLWQDEEIFLHFDEIAGILLKDRTTSTSCCIYKDRAKIAERIRIALGGDKNNHNIIEVIDIICDECPQAGHVVTDLCRGCLAHACDTACRPGAIYYGDDNKAKIDKSKCVECGQCAKACPYSAIMNFKRPCEKACKADAIDMADTGEAQINNEKCTHCGACVVQCPFGATVDKSYIKEAIKIIKDSKKNTEYKAIAVIAPAFATQFNYATTGQVLQGIRDLGFDRIYEAALGADLVAYKESVELEEKGFLTTSCCPAFVSYTKINYPTLRDNISHNLSPMAETSKVIKSKYEDCKIVFIGPCTAKKAEVQLDHVKPYVDCAITFEELQALFESKDIDITTLGESTMDDASPFGRRFARGGGVADAVVQATVERGSDFNVKPIAAEGLDKVKPLLMRASKNALSENLIEGMACAGGCIGGAGCLTHTPKDKMIMDKYSEKTSKKNVMDTVEEYAID
ncbi:MAG: monomeric [FeFe] hydrogenase [Eubacteriales bacterium]|nr:monomeric [FeFe] hydrogenase [Eubacteriales bacterium]MDY3332753.1 monomeric [FeFe] hydrogenase [Gallibacter sp.]